MNMKGSDRRDSSAAAPHPTVLAGGGHSAVVAPHLMTMRNAGKPFNGADEPTHTVTAGGAGLSIVAPFMQKYYGTCDGARVDDPCHSVTTKDRFGFVECEGGWPPFTEAQAERAREVAAFLRAHGFWDEREFVTVAIGGETFTIVDIGMRMLTPRELFLAQGFPPDYGIDIDYEGRPLPKDAQIAACGNSVCPPPPTWSRPGHLVDARRTDGGGGVTSGFLIGDGWIGARRQRHGARDLRAPLFRQEEPRQAATPRHEADHRTRLQAASAVIRRDVALRLAQRTAAA